MIVGILSQMFKCITLFCYQYFLLLYEKPFDRLQLVKDHETGTSRGFAFITFTDADSGKN